MLAPDIFASEDFHTQTNTLHEYLSYVWSMSGDDRGQGGEQMTRQLKKQLDTHVYNFLCGVSTYIVHDTSDLVDTDIMQFFEMEPAKRFTIEEAKWDYMLYWRFATSVISRLRDLTIKQLR